MATSLDPNNLESLLPDFSVEDIAAFVAYEEFFDAHEEVIQKASEFELRRYPMIAQLMDITPPEVIKANNQRSNAIRKAAIFEGKWQEFVNELFTQGMVYAQMGFSFKLWYDVIGVARKIMDPLLERDVVDREKIAQIKHALNILVDLSMSVIGESYIYERAKLMEDERSSKESAQKENASLSAENERIKEVSKLKEQFLANMSHEIRTPLNSILGFADLLRERRLKGEEGEFVEAIQYASRNLLSMINDILDYSKIEAGMITLEEHPLSIASTMHSLNMMLGIKAREKNINLELKCDSSVPELLLGDSVRLTQILINLISNGIKFTNKGGVSVAASLQKEDADYCHIRFTIKDTGIGIAKNKMAVIFERFTQAEADTTRRYGGSGLGLSIVKHLVELQNGEIRVESELKKGSTFTCVLPFKKTAPGAKIQLSELFHHDQDLSHLSVLVAEDNEMNIRLMETVLKKIGLKFQIVKTGIEAVNEMRHNQYDLVLMDIQMPEMDGYQASSYIRKELKSQVPIIALTAQALEEERDNCIKNGMNDYLSKPLSREDLIHTLLHWTSKEQE